MILIQHSWYTCQVNSKWSWKATGDLIGPNARQEQSLSPFANSSWWTVKPKHGEIEDEIH